MGTRATLPLNEAAVKKADDEFYAAHPELIKDGKRIPLDATDPTQKTLRRDWMALYQKNGGQVEGGPPAKKKLPSSPIDDCPLCGKGTLEITVVDQDGKPIEGAKVTVAGIGEMLTNADGVADFGAVDAGPHEVDWQKEFYAPVGGSPDSVNVEENQSNLETLVLKLALSSDDSAKVPDQSGPDVKVVYLTFDDGPKAGTKEVYDLLKSMGVPATFFLVGESAISYEAFVEKGFLKRLYNDPSIQICNHSHTHAHEFYTGFYGMGLKINTVTLEPDALADPSFRRSVLMDFEYANIAFTEVLTGKKIPRPSDPRFDDKGKLDASKLSGYSRFLSSRMPGSNIWRLPGIVASEGTKPEDKLDEAKDLVDNGYLIFGWDDDFDMNFETSKLQHDAYEAGLDANFDLYDAAHIDLDRPNETGQAVFDKVNSEFNEWSPDTKKENKLILLLHDRAFRRYKKGDELKYTNELKSFISLCQKEGYKFDIVKNY